MILTWLLIILLAISNTSYFGTNSWLSSFSVHCFAQSSWRNSSNIKTDANILIKDLTQCSTTLYSNLHRAKIKAICYMAKIGRLRGIN